MASLPMPRGFGKNDLLGKFNMALELYPSIEKVFMLSLLTPGGFGRNG